MANWNQTVSTSLNLLAGTPADLWNGGNWGTLKWGYGSNDLIQRLNHVLGDSLAPTDAIAGHSALHLLTSEAITPTDTYTPYFFTQINLTAQSLAFASALLSDTLSDGQGWNYIFPSNVSNVVNESTSTWSSGVANSNAWTSGVAGSTTWS